MLHLHCLSNVSGRSEKLWVSNKKILPKNNLYLVKLTVYFFSFGYSTTLSYGYKSIYYVEQLPTKWTLDMISSSYTQPDPFFMRQKKSPKQTRPKTNLLTLFICMLNYFNCDF